jgi:hypothetical protein
MTITPELKRVYASAPQDLRYVETLELTHSKFPEPFYITNDTQTWEFTLEDNSVKLFKILPFKIVLPAQDGMGRQDLRISIENVGLEAVEAMDAAGQDPSENINVVYRVYLDKPLSAPQNSPPLRLTVTNISMTLDTIEATATKADTLNRAFPGVVYRTDNYPGLDR